MIRDEELQYAAALPIVEFKRIRKRLGQHFRAFEKQSLRAHADVFKTQQTALGNRPFKLVLKQIEICLVEILR